MTVQRALKKRTQASHRTRKDWALQIKQMLDQRYSGAIKVRQIIYKSYDGRTPPIAMLGYYNMKPNNILILHQVIICITWQHK